MSLKGSLNITQISIRWFNVISSTLNRWFLTLCKDAIVIFFRLIRQGYSNNISSSSSSSCHHILGPLWPKLPIVHRHGQVFRATSHILTELLYVCSSRSSCFCSAISGSPQEYITYELVPASPAVSCISGSSNLDSSCDGRLIAVRLGIYIYIYIYIKKNW